MTVLSGRTMSQCNGLELSFEFELHDVPKTRVPRLMLEDVGGENDRLANLTGAAAYVPFDPGNSAIWKNAGVAGPLDTDIEIFVGEKS